jgi:hypothetical protein
LARGEFVNSAVSKLILLLILAGSCPANAFLPVAPSSGVAACTSTALQFGYEKAKADDICKDARGGFRNCFNMATFNGYAPSAAIGICTDAGLSFQRCYEDEVNRWQRPGSEAVITCHKAGD